MNDNTKIAIDKRLFYTDGILRKYRIANPALMSHGGGISLYFICRYLHTNKSDYRNTALKQLNQLIKCSEKTSMNFGLAQGIAGLVWLINFFKSNNIVPQGYIDTGEAEKLLYLSALSDLDTGHYDLLDGMIGKARVLAGNQSNRNYLTDLTKKLIQISIREKNKVTWYDFYTTDIKKNIQLDRHQVNFGLAHGLPSILLFLSHMYEIDILREEIHQILKDSTSTLIENRLSTGKHLSRYPCNSFNSESSRLAWCYGDLGVAIALLKVSQILEMKAAKEEAYKIITQAATRTFENSGIYHDTKTNRIEQGFCHGVAGVSHLFNRLTSKVSKAIDMERANEYWIQKLLSSLKPNEPEHSFEKLSTGGQWIQNASLLNGTAGVGLVLMSHTQNSISKWDSCFLTDI